MIPDSQKGSPYIHDANRLIRLSVQMGLMDVRPFVLNSTKCDTWHEIVSSHKTDQIVELKMRDIFGMISLLSLGLLMSITSFFGEKTAKKAMHFTLITV